MAAGGKRGGSPRAAARGPTHPHKEVGECDYNLPAPATPWHASSMQKGPTPQPNAHQSATKADVDQLAQAVNRAIDKLATKEELTRLVTKIDGLATKVDGLATSADLHAFKDAIIREFKLVAEHIHTDVATAKADEIAGLTHKTADLDERVEVLERKTGVRLG